jgi:hypothetical protein
MRPLISNCAVVLFLPSEFFAVHRRSAGFARPIRIEDTACGDAIITWNGRYVDSVVKRAASATADTGELEVKDNGTALNVECEVALGCEPGCGKDGSVVDYPLRAFASFGGFREIGYRHCERRSEFRGAHGVEENAGVR